MVWLIVAAISSIRTNLVEDGKLYRVTRQYTNL